MKKTMITAVLAAAALLVPAGCSGLTGEKNLVSEETTQSVITHEYDEAVYPSVSRADYSSLEEYFDAAFGAGRIQSRTKEALSLLSVLARQDAGTAVCIEEAAAYLQGQYPDYLETDRSAEKALYSAYVLMNACEGDKSDRRYTLGAVTANTVQRYYAGEASRKDVQSQIDRMGTQFFDETAGTSGSPGSGKE